MKGNVGMRAGVKGTVAAVACAALTAAVLMAGPALARAPRKVQGYVASGVTEVPDTIRVLMPDGSVSTMEMDEYLKGVVPSEVSPSWPYDSLAAQAVAARCYAATAHRHGDKSADVCTTTHCQAWGEDHYDRTDIAVESTHKVAALYQGEVISSFYFGHCDGHTRNAEDVWGEYVPYCRSVACPCGNTEMWGHGVGMCQEGARVLAEGGWSYSDILKHYYTGVDVQSTEPVATTWYFAEGTTRSDFQTYLCLGNPSGTGAEVTVTYMVEGGENRELSYTVGPNTRKTVDVVADLGPEKDFSCRVSSTNGVGIIAERPMYFNYRGQWSGGHDTMGANYPKTTWYFAEGTTRPEFSTYLCIGNPTDKAAEVTVTYMVEGGENKEVSHTVGPLTRKTIDVASELGADRDFSARVSSTNGVGIIAERPMYFNYRGQWTGGHDTMGANYPKTTWYFAEGTTRSDFQTYLCLGNPSGTGAEVTVTYMVEGGENRELSYTVGPNTRKTVDVVADLGPEKDFSCRVSSTNGVGIIAERPMYFNYRGQWSGGHDTMGANYPKTTWYFAEGTTRPEFSTYLCIGNPTDKAAEVTVTYFRGDGTTRLQDLAVDAGERLTCHVADYLGIGNDPACDFAIKVESTNGAGIVVERPTYFNFRGQWTGGHDTMGH